MFGQNPIRKVDYSDGKILHVQEIFQTIQGEGPYTGMPATFIRLWGCHLHCYFCDTDFESVKTSHTIFQVGALCKQTLVVLTGGEPMRQNIQPLCDLLHEQGHLVQVETAGSFDFQSDFKTHRPKIVVSPKTPFVDPAIAVWAQAWKYIISASSTLDESDGLPVVDFQNTANKRAFKLARPPEGTPHSHIWLQPMDEEPYTSEKGANSANVERCVELALRYQYRISLQTHKLMGVP